ncbi:XkdF-like putative serine protease domain-containing protein [Porcipelethomonas sp.]|uniref:XkdF-like putative serine protease domain-containing protein n=1 Tax=Porcipelethomonas sp. TaxID=2981675 RepID=UPI003079628F
MGEIMKTRSISDAQIQFVSLVDKAANKKSFLIAKAEDGKASFSAYGKIVKTDTDSHYVTGIVYEPMTEDSQGDYMTEEEIRKAAHWFAKNGDGIDIQHNFEKFEKAEVVENWIAKADFEIGKEKIKKGTWLMTVEITDPDVWAAVEKGEITGFSMGGTGIYSEDDVDPNSLSKSEGKSFFKKLAKMFGFEVVEKSEVAVRFKQKNKSEEFWNAFYSLQDTLFKRNSLTGDSEIETDSEKIKECLSDFSEIVQGILADDTDTVMKAGKTLSAKNIASLKSIYESIGKLLEEAGETEENMTKAEVMDFIKNEIQKAESGSSKDSDKLDEKTKKFIVDTIKEVLAESQKNKSVTKEEVAEMVKSAMEPLYKARGIVTNLNGEPEPVGKSDDLFDGLFV